MCVCQKSIIESKAIFINNSDKAIAREKLEQTKILTSVPEYAVAIFYE